MEDYRNKVSNYMQLYPRILVNVLVILVNILVNLLVKLAKLRVRGAMGLRGVHLGEARTISNSIIVSRPATLGVGWLRDYDGPTIENRLETLGVGYETIRIENMMRLMRLL